MSKTIKLSDWCKQRGISYRTGHRWFHSNKIEGAYQTSSGTILVPCDEVSEKHDISEYNVVYARVSSNEQSKTNLEYQAERVSKYINANGKVVHKVVKEVGSGMNDNRPKLKALLSSNDVTAIYVEHKDRLTRFGFEYIKMICDIKGIRLVVINEASEDEVDLMQDFISAITSFCARLYGQRRTKRKTEKIIEALKHE